MTGQLVTLEQFLIEEQRCMLATGDFTALMTGIAVAAKVITREVRRAGLSDILGATDTSNSHGETQQKLDVLANELLCKLLLNSGQLCALTSEELPGMLEMPESASNGRYTLAFDPLDGSSNIDYNVSIGTIFSIHRRVTHSGPGTEADLLQRGSRQVAAGYVVYGSSTIFVYSSGEGVHGFTLDPTIGEFVLSHPDIRTPQRAKTYSINEGNRSRWTTGTRSYVDYVRSPERAGGPCSSRYVGSLVADFHRNLLSGGIFLYPGDLKSPNGKLRLLYEAAPLAFIAENAGGKASTGYQRILDLEPTELHQRVPLIIGCAEDVREAEQFIRREDGPRPTSAKAAFATPAA
ncbi:MAG: Fructose,6-bisphosphatase, type [Armatimonadetes bacterium]|jgi:fructose-1,6-bisphosphatase I|nr:Fructose,6-bisphosphatase, type [Armatimonadota bacterium]